MATPSLCGWPCTLCGEWRAARCLTGRSRHSMEQGWSRRIRYRARSTWVSAGQARDIRTYCLADAARARVYRPLTRRGWGSPCLCTPVRLAQRSLRIGYTTLLQVAFPALPDELETVDVQLATVPPFWRVPVTPPGMLPLASYPTDLARSADPTPVIASTKPFIYRPAGQRYLVMVNAVYGSSSFTSIAWTILSIEPGRGLRAASTAHRSPTQRRPVALTTRSQRGDPRSRSEPDDTALRARLVTTKLAGLGALECLCTDLRSGRRDTTDRPADACDHKSAPRAIRHLQR